MAPLSPAPPPPPPTIYSQDEFFHSSSTSFVWEVSGSVEEGFIWGSSTHCPPVGWSRLLWLQMQGLFSGHQRARAWGEQLLLRCIVKNSSDSCENWPRQQSICLCEPHAVTMSLPVARRWRLLTAYALWGRQSFPTTPAGAEQNHPRLGKQKVTFPLPFQSQLGQSPTCK